MWEDQGAVQVRKDILKPCWAWHAEEPNMAKHFRESLRADLLNTVFIYVFLFDASTKKLFVNFNYHVLLGKYCKKHSVFMISFRYPDKI